MKPFNVYQYLAGEEMTDRDKLEVGSPFWNEGKWTNFVLPHIKETGKDMTFIDMGCNAGLFLKLASDAGFGHVIGVDSDEEAVKKGVEWRNKNNYAYKFLLSTMEKAIDEIPASDYIVFANSHYYMTINDWLDFLDKLQYKTRNCIIITAEKRHLNRCWASADVTDIRRYFKGWEETSFVDELPLTGANPRRLWSMCFKSPHIERVPIDSLDSSNHVQDEFYGELDKGVEYHSSRYYRILVKYRKSWGVERLDNWMEERIAVYNNIKENGLRKPIWLTRE